MTKVRVSGDLLVMVPWLLRPIPLYSLICIECHRLACVSIDLEGRENSRWFRKHSLYRLTHIWLAFLKRRFIHHSLKTAVDVNLMVSYAYISSNIITLVFFILSLSPILWMNRFLEYHWKFIGDFKTSTVTSLSLVFQPCTSHGIVFVTTSAVCMKTAIAVYENSQVAPIARTVCSVIEMRTWTLINWRRNVCK